MTIPGISKMTVTNCFVPWQTETDWYLVGAHGDGADARVVRGWTAVVAECCRLFINGDGIQAAIDRNGDELLDFVRGWANGDEWSAWDNCSPRRPHSWSFSGEGFEAFIYLLTEPPADQSAELDALREIALRAHSYMAGITKQFPHWHDEATSQLVEAINEGVAKIPRPAAAKLQSEIAEALA